MATVLVFILMLTSGLAPFALCTLWMQRGKVGYALTLFSVLAALLTLSVYAASRWIGIDPIGAMSSAMLVFLPGTIGCVAGSLLGWLIYRRRHGGDDTGRG